MRKGRFCYSLFAKSLAFILLVISLIVGIGGALGLAVCGEEGFYSKPFESVIRERYDSKIYHSGLEAMATYVYQGEESLETEYEQTNLRFQIWDIDGNLLYASYNGEAYFWAGQCRYPMHDDTLVEMYVLADFKYYDEWKELYTVYAFLYELSSVGLVVVPIALLLSVILFIYLMNVAGKHYGEEKPRCCAFARIPTDVLYVGIALIVGVSIAVCDDLYWDNPAELVAGIAIIVGLVALFIAACIFLAEKVKTGTFWKNSVCGYAFVILKKLCVLLVKGISKLPTMPVVTLVFLVISFGELMGIALLANYYEEHLLVLWFIEKIILAVVVFYVAYVLKLLQEGGRTLAEGNLNKQMDTSKMIWVFKEHGENLNKIGEGMSKAVDERLKSERMKTELITNVSHDIKTPLTSIINYADLISKEETDNPVIKEYSEVLFRQSNRLRRLTENLVEASKASTGNVEVNLSPCEVGVLLAQTVGEFEQKLEEKGMTLVTKQPEEPIFIMADGKHLWRVFDNLMNNICKYAQDSTRVYLSVEEEGENAKIIFKNISNYQLDISSDELMERFVRGDSSRHTEGNGLGLSIAKSLTDVQNGNMEIVVDGDLFKVILTFPKIK